MPRALTWPIILAVLPVLTQACAGGAMPGAQSTTSASTVRGAPTYGTYGTDRYFTIEWQPDERHGKPAVSGYVTNEWGLGTRNVRLYVQALDAAGNVTASYIGYVMGGIPPGARVYFEVPVRAKAPSYRVSVLSFDPVHGHG
ncbi:MAG: FxLYD domain-containing protein [Gammaproteobacteria bacterium]